MKVKAILFVYSEDVFSGIKMPTSYHFHSGVPIFFVGMGIRMDAHIHRKCRHRHAHIRVKINIVIGVPILA